MEHALEVNKVFCALYIIECTFPFFFDEITVFDCIVATTMNKIVTVWPSLHWFPPYFRRWGVTDTEIHNKITFQGTSAIPSFNPDTGQGHKTDGACFQRLTVFPNVATKYTFFIWMSPPIMTSIALSWTLKPDTKLVHWFCSGNKPAHWQHTEKDNYTFND